MNKKENRIAVRQAAQQAVIRDEQNHLWTVRQCFYIRQFCDKSFKIWLHCFYPCLLQHDL